jgi:hypothetical protein
MSIIRVNDNCKKCNERILVDYGKSECPYCGVLNPVEPNSFIQDTITFIAALGLFSVPFILFGLFIIFAIIVLFIMGKYYN